MKDKTGKRFKPGTPAEARLRIILDSMVEAVYVTDEKGRVTLTNDALDELIARDVRGRRAKNVIKSKELRSAIRRARKKNEATEVELEVPIGEELRAFHAQVAPLPDGTGVVTVLHDVTSLRNADRMRRDFVANASHELRTPLTAIRGFAETLRDGALSHPDVSHRFVDAILRHTLRLQRLADDITMLAQAEAMQHGFEPAPTDLRAVCAESISSLQSYAKKRDITLESKMPEKKVVVDLSGRALEHALINLIQNAIKYSPEGSTVKLTMVRDEEQVVCAVSDEGPGIPREEQERIFERFYRLDKGRSRTEGGTGLGLSIARHMVDRIGGQLELKSKVGEGSTFRIILPLEVVGDND